MKAFLLKPGTQFIRTALICAIALNPAIWIGNSIHAQAEPPKTKAAVKAKPKTEKQRHNEEMERIAAENQEKIDALKRQLAEAQEKQEKAAQQAHEDALAQQKLIGQQLKAQEDQLKAQENQLKASKMPIPTSYTQILTVAGTTLGAITSSITLGTLAYPVIRRVRSGMSLGRAIMTHFTGEAAAVTTEVAKDAAAAAEVVAPALEKAAETAGKVGTGIMGMFIIIDQKTLDLMLNQGRGPDALLYDRRKAKDDEKSPPTPDSRPEIVAASANA